MEGQSLRSWCFPRLWLLASVSREKRLVPSDDEVLLGDVERAIDVAAVSELHELSDDAGHLLFVRVGDVTTSRGYE